MENNQIHKKLRVLCLHSFRTRAEIFKKLVLRWPKSVLNRLDLQFLDAPFPAQGKSPVEGIFGPPYLEWFHVDEEAYSLMKEFKEYYKFEECMEYIEDYMVKNGPFDGVLGFSQGAVLAAAMPGMQREGAALSKAAKIKFVIIISGAKFGGPTYGAPKLAANAFSQPLNCPSLHFLGETDFQKKDGELLLECFVDPHVSHHSKGHAVPTLDEESVGTMLGFIDKIQKMAVQEETRLSLYDYGNDLKQTPMSN